MPLLSILLSDELDPDQKHALRRTVADQYADHMDTGQGHIAVAIDERPAANLWLGRGVAGEPLLFLEADIRRGRSRERKRAFALSVMAYATDELGIPEPNAKVVFTEHAGEQFMGVDRVGSEWSGEAG